jgi:hypothetical protein
LLFSLCKIVAIVLFLNEVRPSYRFLLSNANICIYILISDVHFISSYIKHGALNLFFMKKTAHACRCLSGLRRMFIDGPYRPSYTCECSKICKFPRHVCGGVKIVTLFRRVVIFLRIYSCSMNNFKHDY